MEWDRLINLSIINSIGSFIYSNNTHWHVCTHLHKMYSTVSYLALHSSVFGSDGAVNYDYTVTTLSSLTRLTVC